MRMMCTGFVILWQHNDLVVSPVNSVQERLRLDPQFGLRVFLREVYMVFSSLCRFSSG